ncbi:MAG TPA: hypothetical protein VN663_12925 [Ramlibacter sp.]|nr:hypothetical protein [Ramlibacter sp.]
MTEVVAVERQILDGNLGEGQFRGRQLDRGFRQLAIDAGGNQAANEVPDFVCGHVLLLLRWKEGSTRIPHVLI